MPRCILAMRKGKPVLPRIGAAHGQRRERNGSSSSWRLEARNESRAEVCVCVCVRVDGKGLKTCKTLCPLVHQVSRNQSRDRNPAPLSPRADFSFLF